MPWTARDFAAVFRQEHDRVYGYSDADRAVEVVTVRVRASLAVTKPRFRMERRAEKGSGGERRVRVDGRWRRVPVYTRGELGASSRPGPALVLDYGATTLIPSGWRFRQDNAGNLIVTFASVY